MSLTEHSSDYNKYTDYTCNQKINCRTSSIILACEKKAAVREKKFSRPNDLFFFSRYKYNRKRHRVAVFVQNVWSVPWFKFCLQPHRIVNHRKTLKRVTQQIKYIDNLTSILNRTVCHGMKRMKCTVVVVVFFSSPAGLSVGLKSTSPKIAKTLSGSEFRVVKSTCDSEVCILATTCGSETCVLANTCGPGVCVSTGSRWCVV